MVVVSCACSNRLLLGVLMTHRTQWHTGNMHAVKLLCCGALLVVLGNLVLSGLGQNESENVDCVQWEASETNLEWAISHIRTGG